MKHIVFGKPSIGREEINFVTKVIKSKWIGSGKITQEFETWFALLTIALKPSEDITNLLMGTWKRLAKTNNP